MSYDIKFEKNGETVMLPFEPPRGGTYAVYDVHTTSFPARFNITYNYSTFFALQNISIYDKPDLPANVWVMHGKTAKQVAAKLANILPKMKNGDGESGDYWASTEGNAKQALLSLLYIAAACPPDAICKTY